jgi:hypothetical protein
MNDEKRQQAELIRERRFQAATEARQISYDLGLDEKEAARFLSDAISNAIWDVQQGRAYRTPVYKPLVPTYSGPVYTELGYTTNM